ncbi:MAG: hypothetical protein R3E84_06335 [Pseudomonadales bacterium]
MNAVDYPYASGELSGPPTNYSYARYRGAAFLTAWRDQRTAVLQRCESARPAQPAPTVSPTEALLSGFLRETGTGALDREKLRQYHRILRNFEAKGRLYEDYHPGFTSKGRTDHSAPGVYLAFAELAAALYAQHTRLPYLNALMKSLDILCASESRLHADAAGRLAELLRLEFRLITALGDALNLRGLQ